MAATQDSPSVWREFLGALRNPLNLTVLAVLAAFGVGMSVGSARTFNLNGAAWWDSWLQNFGTEMFGAFLTFLLIEVIVVSRRGRAARDAELEVEKERLILQMSSPFNESAVEAVRQLEWRGWLKGGALFRAKLRGANLHRARLGEANLRSAELGEADLREAYLSHADLTGVNLAYANLQGVDLFEAKLNGAILGGADLQGANLFRTNLQGADLTGAKFDDQTVLPDMNNATPKTDAESMRRFTDPDHPDFWRSDDPYSSAYRGDDNGDNGDEDGDN